MEVVEEPYPWLRVEEASLLVDEVFLEEVVEEPLKVYGHPIWKRIEEKIALHLCSNASKIFLHFYQPPETESNIVDGFYKIL